MNGKKIEDILKLSDVNSLTSPNWNKSTSEIENALKIFEKLKDERYESFSDFETKMAVALTSKKRILTDKLSENLLHFEFFSPLLTQVHETKKNNGRVYNWIGSMSRTFGSMVRGDSSQPEEFESLTDAMKLFEDIYEMDENGIYKVGLGNVLRGLGESISGERTTFMRVLRRTVEGLNPFLKNVESRDRNVKEELDHLVCVSHALLRIFHNHHQKQEQYSNAAAKRYIEYLYSTIFPRFGLFNTSVILETRGEKGAHDTKKEDEDPSVYDVSFYRGIGRFVFFDLIWTGNKKSQNIMPKMEENEEQEQEGEEEEEEEEEESKSSKVDEELYLEECFNVLKKYEGFFRFRHFDEVLVEELEKKTRQELEKIFVGVYLKSYASLDRK